MSDFSQELCRREVREQYNKIIKLKEFGLTNFTCDCATHEENSILGYSLEDYKLAPHEANLGLGCSNPKTYADYKKGDYILDLGCGSGFDCFLASHKVGKNGKVIGVDMMPEMISKAREIAHTYKYSNVEFRLGEIEHLPIESNYIDIIISNCVLNLSPDKSQVIEECQRVLKKGAKLLIFDILLDDSLSEEEIKLFQNMKKASCIKNALKISQMYDILERNSFQNISIVLNPKSNEIIKTWTQNSNTALHNKVYSAMVQANS